MFEWAYIGANKAVPRNVGPECAYFLSPQRQIIETLLVTITCVYIIVKTYPKLHITKEIFYVKSDRGGKRLLVILLALLWGMEIGFKFASKTVIYLLNPCHITTLIQIYLLAAPPSKTVTALFRIHLNLLNGPLLAFLFPETASRTTGARQLDLHFKPLIFTKEQIYAVCVQLLGLLAAIITTSPVYLMPAAALFIHWCVVTPQKPLYTASQLTKPLLCQYLCFDPSVNMILAEAALYWIQHGMMFVIPYYLLRIGGVYNIEPFWDFNWAIFSYCLNLLYHFIILQIIAIPAQVNLNHMLCPAILDPFDGPWYRIAAVIHQAILCPLLCKLFCLVADFFLTKFPPTKVKPHMKDHLHDKKLVN